MADRHFVFLQGMPSPFFGRVARELETWGCRVTGINLCVGDWIFWRGSNTVNYRGRLSDWPEFVTRFFEAQMVSDVVLLGEQRTYHKVAVEAAHRRGIRVTVTDFGYLRPDWITLERDGMSGNSRFPKEPEKIWDLASQVSRVDLSRKYVDSAWNMATGDLLYSFSNLFLGWLYPHYRRSDHRPHPLIYFPAIGRRLLRSRIGVRRARVQAEALVRSRARYFMFPLQLEHDFQIVAYSTFTDLRDALRMVIRSFAGQSDGATRLVVKVHPWDPGLKNWRRIVNECAREFGVQERVDYVDECDLDDLTKGAAGVVTVNSTSGLRALQLGRPVMTLGEALYDIPGLTYQGTLDDFWTQAPRPDPALVDAFINAIAATIQIRGVFFNEPGLTAAVRSTAARLYNETVGVPLATAHFSRQDATES